MRSLLRWLRRVALTVVALAALVVGAALITAHTSWGRERLRGGVEAALRGAFPGGARIGSLDGSLLGTLTLRGVELDGPDHRPLVTAGALQVSVALWPLAVQTARIDRLVADDVHVFVRDQPPEPDRPGAPSAWRVEIAWFEVHGAAVAIERSELGAGIALDRLDAGGAVTVADGRIAVSGAVHGRAARAGRPAAELTAGGRAVLDGSVRIPGAIAMLDGATLVASALVIDPDHPAGSITATAPATVIAAQVPELGGLGGAVPGDLAATIGLADDGGATRLSITAAAGAARLWAALRGEPSRRTVRGVISATSIDLGAATRGRITGRGHLIAALDASPGRVRGALLAFGELAAAGLPVRAAGVAIAGSLDGATAVALGSGDAGLLAAGVARGHRAAGPAGAAGEIVVDGARAVATAAGLAVAGQRITGALALDAATAGGFALGAPARITGALVGRGVTVEPEPGPAAAHAAAGAERLAIAAVRAPFALTLGGSAGTAGAGSRAAIHVAIRDAGAAAVTRGDLAVATAQAAMTIDIAPGAGPELHRAQLSATRIVRARGVLGDARVDVERSGEAYRVTVTAQPAVPGLAIGGEALVRRAGAGYRVELDATRVRLPDGADWAGRGGSLVVPDAASAPIRLTDLTLHRGDTSLALAGSYARATGEITVHAGAEHIGSAALGSAALGSAAGASGLGRATLDLARRGGQWQADAALAVTGLALAPGATAFDGSAHLVLGRRGVALDARATGPALGDLGLALDTAAPADPFDLAAWQTLDRSAIRTAEVTVHGAAVAGLAGLLGPTAGSIGAPAPGTIDGTVDLAPSALRGQLTVRGVALALGVPGGGLDGELTVAPVDGDLGVRATARLAGIAAAEAGARLAVPEHPFDPASLRRGRALLREATATATDVAFDPVLFAQLAGPWAFAALPLSGHLGARLTVGAAARDARLTVDLRGVTGGPLVAPIAQHAELDVGPSGSHLHAELRSDGRAGDGALRLGTLDADAPVTLDRWLAEPAAVLRAPLTARWTLAPTPLAPVLALVGRRELEAGTVEGSAAIGGTVAAPVVSPAQPARLAVHDVRIAPRLGGRAMPAIRALEVAASWAGASGTLEIHGSEATGGELHATLAGRPDAIAAATGTAELTRLDVAPLTAFLPGALASAAGVVDAELALRPGSRVAGRLHVDGGALPLAAALGTLRDATVDVRSEGSAIGARLHGRLGRGTVDVDAKAPADLANASVHVTLRDVSPIAALRPVISAELTAQLHREPGRLRGSVTVEDGASITLPSRDGTQLLDPSVPPDLVLRGAPAALAHDRRAPAHPWLVLDVQARPVHFEAHDLDSVLGVVGTVIGTVQTDRLEVAIGDTVGVTGTVQLDSDDVEILGRRYLVEPAHDGPSRLVFDGTLDPWVQIALSHQFAEVALHVDVSQRLSKREPLKFSSDPPGPYTQDQLFGFFFGGEPSTDPGNPTRDQAREAVTGAGTRLLSAKIGQQLNKVLPGQLRLDLSCDPDPTATTTMIGSCTAGRWVNVPWLSQQAYVAYRFRPEPRPDENAHEAQLQFRLPRGLLLQASGGERGFLDADLLWRHRW